MIVGGESGPGARPFDLSWARALRAQCEGGALLFVKQLGSNCGTFREVNRSDGREGWFRYSTRDRKGGDPAEWPEDLRVREFPS